MLPGSGEGHDFIDRAVQRNVVTGIPYLQGSSKKGSLLNAAREGNMDDKTRDALFGKEGKDGHQGCYAVTDANVMLFPAASPRGAYGWATTPLGLAWFSGLLCDAGFDGEGSLPRQIQGLLRQISLRADQCLMPGNGAAPCPLAIADVQTETHCAALGGLLLKAFMNDALARIAAELAKWVYPEDSAMQEFMKSRVVIMSEEAFRILVDGGMQKEASIQVLDTGVTEPKSLRYSEYLPARTVLVSPEYVKTPRVQGVSPEEAWKAQCGLFGITDSPARHRFGADETTGKGIVRTAFWVSPTAGAGSGGNT